MPEPNKKTNRRWSGLLKFAKSPSRVYPLSFLLAYAVLFVLYDLRQVPKQRSAILDQSFRRLALASDQIRSRIENIAQVMRAEADRSNGDSSRARASNKGELHVHAEDKRIESPLKCAPLETDEINGHVSLHTQHRPQASSRAYRAGGILPVWVTSEQRCR